MVYYYRIKGGLCKMDSLDRCVLETALNRTGFEVDEVEKQDKKTVITVIPYKQTPVFPPKPVPSPKEQGANGSLKG
jgi:hypothetical protein